VASQMNNAELVNVVIDIGVDEEERYLFRTDGWELNSRGFLQAYEDVNGENNGSILALKNLRKGEKLDLINILPKRYFTKPSERYNESRLIQDLEMRGIGRPSTYGEIIDVLVSNDYIKTEKNQLIPTDLGYTINNILTQNFSSFLNIAFTSKLEDELDGIESGEKKFLDVVSNFYQRLNTELERQKKKEPTIQGLLPTEKDEKCPQCGKSLVRKKGRFGSFFACADYPNCRFTKSAEKDTAHISEKCELCGKDMVVKVGPFGRFLACVGYPECKNSKPFHIGVKCPQNGCDGDIIERISERGRLFFGCSKYPECDFISWQKPVGYRCSKCGNFYVEQCHSQTKGEYLRCPKCKTEFNI
jgi:DNA topoisomerase-1